MKKHYLAFYDYAYTKENPLYKQERNKSFQYVLVVEAADKYEAKNKALAYLYEKAEKDNIVATNLTIEETEIVK